MTHLSQLLIEIGSVDLSFLITFLVVQVQIPANKKRAQELLHLHSHIEWDGDDKVIEDQKCQEVRDELKDLKRDEIKKIYINYWSKTVKADNLQEKNTDVYH